MSTPGHPPTSPGDVPADTSMWGGDSAVADARSDREQRLAADEAQLAAGAHPGHDEQAHGASASDPIG